ncbi:MAG: ABC transporter substrate-binding protein [Desulfovibrio sp.]|uniref:ABC transporter substrate-binding protein n=1 Tax=Desulfovibrio sp. 7SRBS1 TaxID=3378064 RepID=UPI003B406E9D
MKALTKIHTLLTILPALFIMLCSAMVKAENGKDVIVIQSYHPTLTWTRQCDTGILKVLGNLNVKFYYLDSKRLAPEQFAPKVDAIYSEVLQQSPDLVMIGDDTAFNLLGLRIAKLKIPVVFFGMNNNPRKYFWERPSNLAGLLERTPVLPTARILKSLLPSARKMLFLFDNSPTSDSLLEITIKDKRSLRLGTLSLKFKVAYNWAEWKKAIRRAGRYDLVVIPTFHALKDADGNHVGITKALDWTTTHCPVPVFSCQEHTVHDTGTVGAFTLDGVHHGESAARIALRILQGTPPADIPLQVDSHGQLYLNKKQLERFHISVPEELAHSVIFQ